jgi:ankyrin repeat protein
MADWRLRWVPVAVVLLASTGAQARVVADADALPRAIGSGDVGAVEAALAHADPNRPLAFGATALAEAVYAQNPAMVAALIKRGAKPNIADAQGLMPLSLACELGNRAIVGELLDAHADVRAAAPDGTGALAVCARYGPSDAVARMLARGAAADAPDARGQTPLMWAAASGRVEAMQSLIKAGAGIDRVSKAGFSPLFFAIKSGVPAATELLLAAGADAGHRGPENTSAAQLAAYQHNDAALALLVAHGGVDLGERDREGWQLLHRAAAAGDAPLVALLLAKHADPDALTGPSRIKWVTEANFGVPPRPFPPTPPLLLAAGHGRAEAMKTLVAAGANPRFVAEDGTNVVLAAAAGGSAAALELALSLAPDANVADARGATPLHVLVGGNPGPEFAAMLKLLAAHGARPDIRNKQGDSAATIAMGGLAEVKAAFVAVFGAPAETAAKEVN